MNSSNDLLKEFAGALEGARDPGFAVIVAFDYYDGPERGLALYPSGEGVRFASVGDSNSRLFRAFELVPIRGNWWAEVKALQRAAGIDPPRRVLVPAKASDTLEQFEKGVIAAPATGQYVGLGTPDLEQISVSAISKEQLDALRQVGCSPAGFRSAHRLVKGHAVDE
jgi:hypothetical protein